MSADGARARAARLRRRRGEPPPPPGPRLRARPSYRFDVLCDYGAFRDLQRHRLLTLEWQRLTPRLGYDVPRASTRPARARLAPRAWTPCAALYAALAAAGLPEAAPYAVPMAYRVRFVMEMNAREAMHLIELRSSPQGHPAYRRVAQEMHRLIAERGRPPRDRRRDALRRPLRAGGGRLAAERRLAARQSAPERRQGAATVRRMPDAERPNRLGGMALANGLLVHGPRHWAAAVRADDGAVLVASGAKVVLSEGRLGRVPLVRGILRLGEAMMVVPTARRGLPEARLAMEDRPVAVAALLSAVLASQARRWLPSILAQETIGAVAGLAPALVAMRGSQAAIWHGVEHKSIAAYERGGAGAVGEAGAEAKEHDRCGGNLILPLMVTSTLGNTLLRKLVPAPRDRRAGRGGRARIGAASKSSLAGASGPSLSRLVHAGATACDRFSTGSRGSRAVGGPGFDGRAAASRGASRPRRERHRDGTASRRTRSVGWSPHCRAPVMASSGAWNAMTHGGDASARNRAARALSLGR